MTSYMNDDVVAACANLTDRCGASGFEIGYLHDDVPVEQAGWHASAEFKGARIMVEDQQSPTMAAFALAARLLTGAQCKCGRPVTMTDDRPGCRWRLMGPRWEPGCSAPAVRVSGERGDLGAMHAALAERQGNRAERRAARRKRK
jgi:hypothetical protein